MPAVMSTDSVHCFSCLKMDYEIVEGLPKDYYSRPEEAEDAMEFELHLAEAKEVKYSEQIEKLEIGSLIICTGTPSEDIPWFAVNIGVVEEDDRVAVHFNVRMPQAYVVRNTKRSGKWGTQEMNSFRHFPFKVGRPFTIEILVKEQETLWAVDGLYYCSYVHRSPTPLLAQSVEVIGVRDATLKVIKKAEFFPTQAPKPQEVPLRLKWESKEEDEMVWSPHTTALMSDGIRAGYQIVIKGRLRPMLYSFTLDLMDRPYEWPTPNILLRADFRPYDDPQRSRQLVVLNAYLGGTGGWGNERRQRTAKLVPGTVTTIRISRQRWKWIIYQNEMQIGEFEHRADPNGVNCLRIRGDLYPQQIFICPVSHLVDAITTTTTTDAGTGSRQSDSPKAQRITNG